MSSIFDQLAKIVCEKGQLVLGEGTALTCSDIRKIFLYVCAREGIEWPYTFARDFNSALQSYTAWNPYRPENKIIVSCPTELHAQAKHHHSQQKGIACRTRAERVKSLFANPPQHTDIPIDRVNVLENRPSIRPLSEMIIPEVKCLALAASPGLGKTIAIVEYIGQCPSSTPSIVVSFRIALSEKLNADLAHLGFQHYFDFKREQYYIQTNVHHRVVIQVDSIMRLKGTASNFILVLDEWESLIEHIFTSPFIDDRSELVGRMVELVRRSQLTILSDANLCFDSIKFFEKIFSLSPLIYCNRFIRTIRYAYFCHNKGELVFTIYNFLKEGKRVYVPTNNRGFGEYLVRFLAKQSYPGKVPEIKFYHRNTPLLHGVDPISDMIKYDCCIATPKFQAGNSFVADHFDVVCGYFCVASCSAEASSQLLMRIRNVRSQESYFYIDDRLPDIKPVIYSVETFSDMVEYIEQGNVTRTDDHELVTTQGVLTKIKLQFDGTLDLNKPANYLGIICATRINQGHKDYLKRFIVLIISIGYVFGGYRYDDQYSRAINASIPKEIKIIREEEREREAQAVADAELITAEEAADITRRIKQRYYTSHQERSALRKHRLLQIFSLTYHSDFKIVKRALELEEGKRLMIALLPTVLIQDHEIEQKNLELIINQLAGLDGTDKTLQIYQLHRADQALMIGYLLACLRRAGFDGFFDLSTVVFDTARVASYVRENKEKLKTLLGKQLTDCQLNGKRTLRWLNSKLQLLHLYIERKSRNTKCGKVFVIESPWCVVYRHNKVTIACPEIEQIEKHEYLRSTPDIITRLSASSPF